MEHQMNNQRAVLPMVFLVKPLEKMVNFATDDLVMEGDVIHAMGVKGTVKQILEERPCRGNWKKHTHVPTFYSVKLY